MKSSIISFVLIFSFVLFPAAVDGGDKVCEGECSDGSEYLVRETRDGGSYTVTTDGSGQIYLTVSKFDPGRTCASLGKGFC